MKPMNYSVVRGGINEEIRPMRKGVALPKGVSAA
jgi:hypothetical protein